MFFAITRESIVGFSLYIWQKYSQKSKQSKYAIFFHLTYY